jgi:hypothetical protein
MDISAFTKVALSFRRLAFHQVSQSRFFSFDFAAAGGPHALFSAAMGLLLHIFLFR